jgi:hypothetical protein
MVKWNRAGWIRPAYLGLVLLTLANCGCLVVAAGAAGGAALGYVYYQGELSGRYNADFPATWTATRTALADLGMPVVKEEYKDGSGYIESRTSRDDTVRINLSAVGQAPAPALTQVGVRVGILGDDKVSELVLDQIGARVTSSGGGRVVPVPQPNPGGVQPASAFGNPPETPPPPLARASAPGETPPPPLAPIPVKPPSSKNSSAADF